MYSLSDDWLAYLAWAISCVTGLLITLAGTYRGKPGLAFAGKLVAATAYLGAAIALDAHETVYGRYLLTGMCCCWLGDMLLISDRSRVLFVTGLATFLAGHVIYSAAFLSRGVAVAPVVIAAGGMTVFAIGVLRWLRPHLPDRLRLPVFLYVMAISVMAVLAAGTFSAHGGWALLLGAVLFVLSDLAVARHRFVQAAFANRAMGLPLYFTAQLLLAASTR